MQRELALNYNRFGERDLTREELLELLKIAVIKVGNSNRF